jgi:hypothetical protein
MPSPQSTAAVYSFETSGHDLVRKAMKKLRVLGVGQQPTAEELSDGLDDLNQLLDNLNSDKLLVTARTRNSYTLTGSDGEYTIGPSGDIDTARPVRIMQGQAFLDDGSVQLELEVIDQPRWGAIADPDIDGTPNQLYYEASNPLGRIRLFPRPSSGQSLVLYEEALLAQITNGDTEFSLPPVYADILLYNLCLRLADDYGKEPSATILSRAGSSIAKAKSVNRRTPRLVNDGPGSARGTGYNITVGPPTR